MMALLNHSSGRQPQQHASVSASEILNQPEQGSGVPVVLGSPREPKFLYGLGNDGVPILNLTGTAAANRMPLHSSLVSTGPDGAMTGAPVDDVIGSDGMPVKYLSPASGATAPVVNVRGHYSGVSDDLALAKNYIARGHASPVVSKADDQRPVMGLDLAVDSPAQKYVARPRKSATASSAAASSAKKESRLRGR